MAKKYSKEGDTNLEIIDKANNFTNWMYEQIKPFLFGNILEIGSGRGTYSKKIIDDFPNSKIVLSDKDADYVSELKKNYQKPNLSVTKIDLEKKLDFKKIKCSINSAFVLNVLEHVKNDVQALENLHCQLAPGGKLIILVPAHKFLFNNIDKGLGHYRRYIKNDLLKKIAGTKFKVKKLFYFNFLSIFGWYWKGTYFKKAVLNERMVRCFNQLVPFLRFFEKYILRNKLGMSLIVVLEK